MTKMEQTLCLYTHKLFPQFSTPAYSRFSTLFSELSEKDFDSELIKRKNSEDLEECINIEKYRINPKTILNGIEKRNSIIIKGIPNSFGARNFYELLVKFCKDISFFYIPGFAINKWKYIYAFATIGSRKGVLNIYEGLTLIKEKYKTFKGFDFSKIEIYFCKSQNIIGLTKKNQKKNNKKNFIICK